jgi:hypothetical protein
LTLKLLVPLHHVCEACIKVKHQRTSFSKDELTRASKLLKLVHGDVCAPIKIKSHGGAHTLSPLSALSEKNSYLPFESKRRGV